MIIKVFFKFLDLWIFLNVLIPQKNKFPSSSLYYQDYGDDNYDDDDDAGGCGADITLDENGLSQQQDQQALAFGGDGLVAPPNKVCAFLLNSHINTLINYFLFWSYFDQNEDEIACHFLR